MTLFDQRNGEPGPILGLEGDIDVSFTVFEYSFSVCLHSFYFTTFQMIELVTHLNNLLVQIHDEGFQVSHPPVNRYEIMFTRP